MPFLHPSAFCQVAFILEVRPQWVLLWSRLCSTENKTSEDLVALQCFKVFFSTHLSSFYSVVSLLGRSGICYGQWNWFFNTSLILNPFQTLVCTTDWKKNRLVVSDDFYISCFPTLLSFTFISKQRNRKLFKNRHTLVFSFCLLGLLLYMFLSR